MRKMALWSNNKYMQFKVAITKLFILFFSLTFVLHGCKWFENEPLKVEYQVSSPGLWGGTDGKIKLLISGGYPPYKIQWSNDATSLEISNLKAGNYLAMVEDSKGKTLLINIRVDHLQGPVCTDRDGNSYNSIVIGNMAWTTTNLYVKTNSKGVKIPFHFPGNDSLSALQYGLLYDWETMMDGSISDGAQGICPDGWHIPSDAEWKKLTDTYPASRVGKMLTDSTMGFNMLPAGFFSTDAFGFGTSANFWTSSRCHDNAWKRFVYMDQAVVYRYHGNIKHAYSEIGRASCRERV